MDALRRAAANLAWFAVPSDGRRSDLSRLALFPMAVLPMRPRAPWTRRLAGPRFGVWISLSPGRFRRVSKRLSR